MLLEWTLSPSMKPLALMWVFAEPHDGVILLVAIDKASFWRCVLDNIAVKASNKVCYYQGKQALWWQPFGPTHCGTRLLMLPK
jgi:hypothetical protein